MKYQTANILLFLTVLFSCKTFQSPNFIKSRKEKQIRLVEVSTPLVLFKLENGDTLKFSCHDIYSILINDIKKQINSQGYLSSQTWQDIAIVMKNQSADTIVFQNLSEVNYKTLSGILEIWVARELLLKGKAIVGLRGQNDNPKKLKYVYIRDYLGGEQGNFYDDKNKLIYSSPISFGE